MSNQLLRTKKTNPCPICANVSGKCRIHADSPIVLCGNLGDGDAPIGYRYVKPSSGIWNIFAPDTQSDDWQTRLEARVERDRNAIELSPLSLKSRHALLSAKTHTLTPNQNSDLLRRGLTQSEIDLCLSNGWFWQERDGYGIGAIDPVTGLTVGGQLARDDRDPKYLWLLPGQTHLPETGQNPLAVWVSPQFDRTKPYTIHFCEGFLKPLVSTLKSWRSDPQQIWIGAAGGQFQDAALARILAEFPDATSTTLYPDGGAVLNPNVMHGYRSLSLAVPSLQIAWWGQWLKSDPDCDELTGNEQIFSLDWKTFSELPKMGDRRSLNEKYLPKIKLPSAGFLAVSSPTGSGKTEIVEDLLFQFFQRHPDGIADAIGYRNNLLIQTTKRIQGGGRLTTVHKHQMDRDSGGWSGSTSLAYCLNSLDQRLERLHQAIDAGQMVLILLDEVGFIVSHWLDLMKSQPKTGLNFARLLRRIGEGHGYIIGLQANLTTLPIDLLREITGHKFPLTLIENQFQGEPWRVTMRSSLSKKLIPSNNLSGLGAAQTIFDSVRDGKFCLITTSGREWLERLDTVLLGQGFKLLRVDRFTVAAAQNAGLDATPDQKIILDLRENPKRAIENARKLGYSAIGLTPTCETGISIDGINFDFIIDYAPAGTSEAVLQRLARDRNNSTPRIVFATDRAADYRADINSDPDRILKSWRLNSAQGFNVARVADSLTPDEKIALTSTDELLEILANYAAIDLARSNSDRGALNENIFDRLTAAGHHVDRDMMEISADFRELWKTAGITIADRNHQMFAQAAVITPDEANETMRSGSGTREQIYSAQKTITLENYPTLDLDDSDLVGRLIFDRRGAALAAYTQFWMLKNPAVAQQIDRACWKSQLGRGIIWAPSLKREALKSQTFVDTGILDIIALDEYSENTPEVQTVRSRCIQNRHQLRRVCGYAAAFDESHSGIEMVGWILRRMEFKQVVSRKIGRRGEQIRFWKTIDKNLGDRNLVEAALAVKWETIEPIQNAGSTTRSHDFSMMNPDRKIVTTGLSDPLKNIEFEAEIYEFTYIPTPEEIMEWGIAS